MSIKKVISKDQKKCKVTFTLPTKAAPEAKIVKVVGDFNNWDWSNGIELTKSSGEYKGQMELEPGQRYEFRYLIDNKRWDNDWMADEYVPSPFGGDNSVVITPSATATAVTVSPKAQSSKANKAPTSKTKSSARVQSAKTIKKKSTTKTSKKNSNIDFTVIEGIGPKICQILENAGYNDFAALGTAKIADLRKVLHASGPRYQMHDPSKWAKQAKMAAKDQWSKLNEFQATLKVNKK